MSIQSRAGRHYALGLSFAAFVALGIVNGLLGVAWPSIRSTFQLPLDALVALLASTTVGFVLGSVLVAQFMGRAGVGWTLLVMNLLAAAGLFGYALAPGWWVLVMLGLAVGWASGAIDTALNIYVAATRSVRTMNWMHACFGIGATIGPLVMTAVVTGGRSWRLGYLLAGLVHLGLGLLFLSVVRTMNFRGAAHATPGDVAAHPAPAGHTLRLTVVWLSILLFLLYTGVESTAGQWTYTWFTEGRGIPGYLAGTMTSVFWAMLTVGRVVFGAAAARLGTTRLLRLSMVGTLLASLLLLAPWIPAGFVAIALLGLSLAAIFPTLTSDTPNRVGRRHAANTIGLQTGAASIGFAILPGTAGAIATRAGLESLGPFLVVTSLLMLLTNEVALSFMRRRRVDQAPVGL